MIRKVATMLCLAIAMASYAQDGMLPCVVALAGTPSGADLIFGVNYLDANLGSHLYMISTSTGQIEWQLENLPTIASLAVAPGGDTVAVGFRGVADSDAGVVLLGMQSGKQVADLGFDEKLEFAPGVTYPRWGDGVAELAFSPDGTLLYGLSNDTLFAWDVTAKRYLWTRDVPAVIEAPPDLPDPLPYGHATTFALSSDGRQIAAARDALRIATAGRTKPPHFIKRSVTYSLDFPAKPAFSADNRILAVGEFNHAHDPSSATYATEFWENGALKAHKIDGCGGGIAWTDDPDIFACQNASGAHLRNIHQPAKDIGAAGPASDLPILKAGHSLWVASYRNTDWKDPDKPLPLTLVELGTGKHFTVTLPGRTPSRAPAL